MQTVTARELAETMTLMDFALLVRIEPREFLHKVFLFEEAGFQRQEASRHCAEIRLYCNGRWIVGVRKAIRISHRAGVHESGAESQLLLNGRSVQ
jgi:hypothetical protein